MATTFDFDDEPLGSRHFSYLSWSQDPDTGLPRLREDGHLLTVRRCEYDNEVWPCAHERADVESGLEPSE